MNKFSEIYCTDKHRSRQTNNQICSLFFRECLLSTLEHFNKHFDGLTRFDIRRLGAGRGMEGGKEGTVAEEVDDKCRQLTCE